MRAINRARAFTLIELIAVIIVLAILSGVAIPKYFDYAARAKESSTKATLGAVRAAVANYYANQVLSTGGTGSYPSLVQLQAIGTVMQEPLPKNPYNDSSDISAATYNSAAPPVSGTAGWNYDASNGRFWANTDTSGIDENEW